MALQAALGPHHRWFLSTALETLETPDEKNGGPSAHHQSIHASNSIPSTDRVGYGYPFTPRIGFFPRIVPGPGIATKNLLADQSKN